MKTDRIALTSILALWLCMTTSLNGCLKQNCAPHSDMPSDTTPRVVALPVVHEAGDPILDAYCVRLVEDLCKYFSWVREVNVCPTSAGLSLPESERTVEGAAKYLDAKYVSTAKVSRHGDSLVVEIGLYKTPGERLHVERFTTSTFSPTPLPERTARELTYQIAARHCNNMWDFWWDQPSKDSVANSLYFEALDEIRSNPMEVNENRKDRYEATRDLIARAVVADSSFVMARILQCYAVAHASAGRFWYDDSTRKAAEVRADSLQNAVRLLAPDFPETYLMAGKNQQESTDSVMVESRIKKALEIRPGYPAAYRRLGDFYSESGHPIEAREAYATALDLYTKYGDWRNQAELLNILGFFYKSQNKPDSAIACAEKMISILTAHQTANYSSQAYLALMIELTGMKYADMRDYARTSTYLQTAVELSEKALVGKPPPQERSGDYWIGWLMRSFYYSLLGRYSDFAGNYQTAVLAYQKAAQQALEMNEPELNQSWKNNMIAVYGNLGDYQQAMQVAISDTGGHQKEFWLRNVGAIHFAQGNLDSAWYYQSKAWELRSKDTAGLNDHYKLTAMREVMRQLSIILYARGDYAEARDTLNAIQLDSTVETDWRLAYNLMSGAIEAMGGSPDAGIQRMTSALDSMVIYADRVEGYRVLGDVCLKFDRRAEARKFLEEGRTLARKAGMKGQVEAIETLMKRTNE